MKSILTAQGALRLGVALMVVLGLLGGGFAFMHHAADNGAAKAAAGHDESEGDEAIEAEIPVKIVYPRYDKSFSMTERRPADVLPYYKADLVTSVPGYVEWMPYDVGSQVTAGETLVQVAVPDLVARRNQRKADLTYAETVVKQRKATVEVAKADYEAAKARINASEARLRADQAYEVFRRKQAKRYTDLLRDRAIDAQLVDEQEDQLHAAIEATNASKEKVISAREDAKAAAARIQQAEAEWHEAEAKVEVAKAELSYAQAMLDYATIKAPFDGVIIHRNVDPGFFVQNASSGHAVPLLTVARNDILTLVMRVPDNYAPYVTPQTEAIFETALLPGVKIHGKVTRYSPALITPDKDRTMLVEVDLWNRSPQEFEQKKNDNKFLNGLKKGMTDDLKSRLPVVPKIQGNLAGRQLLPGMYGDMTLVLRNFENVHMLPSQAIVHKGGNDYIYVVKSGKAQLQLVKVLVDDGKLVNVELLDKEGGVIGPLTGNEEVIVTNQGELSEDQPVKPALVEDWKSLVPGGDRNEKR